MLHPNQRAIRGAYEAFGRGDASVLMGLLADDVRWHALGPGPVAGDYVGKSGVRRFFGKMAEAYGDTLRLDVTDILADDEHVVVLTNECAEHEGRPVAFRSAHVYAFEQGKCVRFVGFRDDAPASFGPGPAS